MALHILRPAPHFDFGLDLRIMEYITIKLTTCIYTNNPSITVNKHVPLVCSDNFLIFLYTTEMMTVMATVPTNIEIPTHDPAIIPG